MPFFKYFKSSNYSFYLFYCQKPHKRHLLFQFDIVDPDSNWFNKKQMHNIIIILENLLNIFIFH